jgi:hypothetical protein
VAAANLLDLDAEALDAEAMNAYDDHINSRGGDLIKFVN